MTHLDYLKIVRTESHRNRSSNRHKAVYTHGKQKKKGTHQSYEKIACRALSKHKGLIYTFRPVSVKIINHCRCRHSSEHGICPCCRVVRMSLVMRNRFLRHSLPSGDITLIDNLSIKHLRHKTISHNSKEQDNTCISKNLLYQFLIHNILLFN